MFYATRLSEVAPNLFVGSQLHSYHHFREDMAVVHAAKIPDHQYAVGYQDDLPKSHPNYWIVAEAHHLYLNLVDSDRLLFVPELFTQSLAFIRQHIDARQVLITSNHGLSRAPSIALLYLAKVAGAIDDSSYDAATADFSARFPAYQPGRGLVRYLRREWASLKLPT